MQINTNRNNVNPQFGMFLKSASCTNKRILAETLNQCNSRLGKRALKQFEKEQSKLKNFDIVFNPGSKSVYIIDTEKGLVLEEFPFIKDQRGIDIISKINFPGKKFLAKLFNPKKFLPTNFYLAGEKAKSLEQKIIERDYMLRRREYLNKTINI